MAWHSQGWSPNILLGLGLPLPALQECFTVDAPPMEACNKLQRVHPVSSTSVLKYFLRIDLFL